MSESKAWYIYRGTGKPHDGIDRLPPPPPWRPFDSAMVATSPLVNGTDKEAAAGTNYRPDDDIVELVNAAIYLRRPLLVTGRPGTGKSTLAAAIAHELRLGKVLRWNITSRVTRREGLYEYDALARLYAASRRKDRSDRDEARDEDLGQYIRLGPLGTALLPKDKPRVLLIDEIDKSDLDLPNELLTIFEEGEFEIPELMRQSERFPDARVNTYDSTERVTITLGRVLCKQFPIVVMTSNEEREFPPAFLRRCITVRIEQPGREKLEEIVSAHLPHLAPSSDDLIGKFLEAARDPASLATDQLLNAIYLVNAAARAGNVNRLELAEKVMPALVRHPA